jgi:hypothetical protein
VPPELQGNTHSGDAKNGVRRVSAASLVKKPKATRGRLRNRPENRTRKRMAKRIERFGDRQRRERHWIQFTDLAWRYGLKHNSTADGYDKLRESVLAGKFEHNGKGRVLYLNPVATTIAKMTRQRMANAVATFSRDTVHRAYLGYCWLPRDLAIAWCKSHKLAVDWIDPVSQLPPLSVSRSAKAKGGGRPSEYDYGPAIAAAADLCALGWGESAAASEGLIQAAPKDRQTAKDVERVRQALRYRKKKISA